MGCGLASRGGEAEQISGVLVDRGAGLYLDELLRMVSEYSVHSVARGAHTLLRRLLANIVAMSCERG